MGNAAQVRVRQRLSNIRLETPRFQLGTQRLTEYHKSSRISAENKRSYLAENSKVKILLLGPGESGKSTLFRQLRLLYGRPLPEDTSTHLRAVYRHTFLGMKQLIMNTPPENLEKVDKKSLNIVKNISMNGEVDEKVGNALKSLWNDPRIRQTWKRRNEFQIFETTRHFMENMDNMMQKEYVPTIEDILHVRHKTNGVRTEKFSSLGTEFEVYDVGGQRNERNKWIHLFNKVSAIIFVAAISEYDQVLFEDSSKNRLQESVELFADVCNNENLKQPSLVLYLNKIDLFQAKIQYKNLNSVQAFSDYDGDLGEVDSAVQYIIDLFLRQNLLPRTIYHHILCALDTESVRQVFELCHYVLLHRNLNESGFIC